jgi:3-oxocholest-4-en-26-oyl-CoA dehydrogenase beta subunit
MDFTFTKEQEELRGLARRILGDRVTRERLQEIVLGPDSFDRELWGELGRAHLLGVALPEDVGGSGYGLIELCVLMEEAGRAVAPVPLVSSLAMAALPVAQFGSEELRKELLPSVAAGEAVMSAAITEGDLHAAGGAFRARRDGDRWRFDGGVSGIPSGDAATRVLVPASGADGAILALVDPRRDGVSIEPQVSTTGRRRFLVELNDVLVDEDDVLGGNDVLSWTVDRALVSIAAMQLGAAERALRITADYVSGREQFGKPLGAFQAVQQRIADCYIDVEALRWTMWRAAWRLAEGLPASGEVAVSKFWAAETGYRVLAAAQHLHGGVGVDVDYPIHRYTLLAKELELWLGGANRHLERLGAMMAAE